MKILLVTIDFPLPVNAGGVVRLLGISEALARRGLGALFARSRAFTFGRAPLRLFRIGSLIAARKGERLRTELEHHRTIGDGLDARYRWYGSRLAQLATKAHRFGAAHGRR